MVVWALLGCDVLFFMEPHKPYTHTASSSSFGERILAHPKQNNKKPPNTKTGRCQKLTSASRREMFFFLSRHHHDTQHALLPFTVLRQASAVRCVALFGCMGPYHHHHYSTSFPSKKNIFLEAALLILENAAP